MKWITKCLICLLVVCLVLPGAALAADTTKYTVEELGLTVTIPDDLIIFGRQIDPDDPNLSIYGLNAQELEEQYRKGNIYLNVVSPLMNYEILVTMVTYPGDMPFADLRAVPDAMMASIEETMHAGFEAIGARNIRNDRYDTQQMPYLRLHYERENAGSMIYSLQFSALVGQQFINLTLNSYGKPIASEQEDLLQGIVDSAVYEAKSTPADTASRPADIIRPSAAVQALSTYISNKGGIRFTIPAGWSEKPFTQEREAVDVKFANNEGNLILFGCTDVWSILPDEEKTGLSRSDCRNKIMSDSDVADMYQSDGMTVSSVEREVIADTEYFLVRAKKSMELGPADLNIDMTTHILIYNGWMYTFTFSGKATSTAYEDYKTLLSSAQYDDLPAANGSSDVLQKLAKGQPAADGATDFFAKVFALVISFALTITLYTLPILIYRYCIKKEPLPPNKARKIAVIYGICAFAASVAIFVALQDGVPGGAVFLWSYVNYRILRGGGRAGRATPVNSTSGQRTDIPVQPPKALFCTQCGARLATESCHCPACGARVHQNTNTP